MRRDEESEINSDKDKVSHNVQSDHKYIPYLTIPTFKGPGENAYENFVGKKKMVVNSMTFSSPFPEMSFILSKTEIIISVIFDMSVAKLIF